MINRPSSHRRSVTQYYSEMLAFEQRKQAKLEHRRSQLAPSAPSFRPAICSKSHRLTHSRSGSVFTRLQQWKPAGAPCTDPQPNFRPYINPRSRNIARPGSVSQRLYEAASHTREVTCPSPRSQSPIQTSEDLASRKFDTEMQQAASDLPDPLNYTQMRLMLDRLHMLGNDRNLSYRVWVYLAKENKEVTFAKVKAFLCAAVNCKGTNAGIHAQFRDLSINRLAAAPVPRTEPTPPRRSTTPEAQQRSIQRLLTFNSEKKQVAVLQKQQDELKECTFKPMLVAQDPGQTTEGDSLAAAYRRLLSLSKGSRHEKLHRLAAVVQTRKLEVPAPPVETVTPPRVKRRSLSQVSEPPRRAAETAARLRHAREEVEWRAFRKSKGLNNCSATERKKKMWRAQRSSSVTLW